MYSPRYWRMLFLCLASLTLAPQVRAQGPMPEEGATLFPHGAFLSYNSILTSNRRLRSAQVDSLDALQPTFTHEMPLAVSWSPRRDWQLTATVPVVLKRSDVAAGKLSASGLGDMTVGFKYRFLRMDSERGTTQAALEVAPKLPTGSTTLADANGTLLSPHMQPGSGSLDWRIGLTTTYTGLFGFRRLVADAQVVHLLRTENARRIDMGDVTEARLWIHFRPLQTKLVGGEWFIGPDLQWKQNQKMRVANVAQVSSGNDIVTAGVTTYISPRGGLTFWASATVPIVQDWNGAPYEQRSRLSVGIAKQFVIGR